MFTSEEHGQEEEIDQCVTKEKATAKQLFENAA